MKQCSRRRRAAALEEARGRRERIVAFAMKFGINPGYIPGTVSAFPTFSADITSTV
jgi:hypothetical protein